MNTASLSVLKLFSRTKWFFSSFSVRREKKAKRRSRDQRNRENSGFGKSVGTRFGISASS